MNYPLKNGIMMTKEEKIEYLESEVKNLAQACTERAQERDRACKASNEWQEKLNFATSTFGFSLLKVEEEKRKLKKPRVEVWMLLPQGREDVDYYDLWHQGDTHIGPIWGLSPNDVEGRAFSDGAIEAIRDLNPSNVPANAFAIKFLMTDLEWEAGEPSCGLPAGWMMKAEVIGYDIAPEMSPEEIEESVERILEKAPATFAELLKLNPPVTFGLKAQGHVPTIEKMLDEGHNWEQIAKHIGWCPKTLQEHWERLQ